LPAPPLHRWPNMQAPCLISDLYTTTALLHLVDVSSNQHLSPQLCCIIVMSVRHVSLSWLVLEHWV
jgi:hypothetical protein